MGGWPFMANTMEASSFPSKRALLDRIPTWRLNGEVAPQFVSKTTAVSFPSGDCASSSTLCWQSIRKHPTQDIPMSTITRIRTLPLTKWRYGERPWRAIRPAAGIRLVRAPATDRPPAATPSCVFSNSVGVRTEKWPDTTTGIGTCQPHLLRGTRLERRGGRGASRRSCRIVVDMDPVAEYLRHLEHNVQASPQTVRCYRADLNE